MEIQLVYHHPGRPNPFWKSIRSVKADGSLLLAVPYISMSMLSRLLVGLENWRLLTDLSEWGKTVVRPSVLVDFLKNHPSNVRHVHGLHAKVFIGPRSALIGSANLTEMGFNQREEMGILIGEPYIVQELRQWFEHLWGSARPIDIPEVEAKLGTYVERIKQPQPNLRFDFKAKAPNRARIDMPTTSDVYRNFVKIARKLSSKGLTRDFLYGYFELAGWLIGELGVGPNDPRIVFSPKFAPGKTGNWLTSLTINHRYFLLPLYRKENIRETFYSFTIPRRFAEELGLHITHNFGDSKSKSKKLDKAGEPPVMIEISTKEIEGLDPLVFRGWIEAAQKQLLRARSSPERHVHQPWLFQAAVNRDYRETLLAEIFEA